MSFVEVEAAGERATAYYGGTPSHGLWFEVPRAVSPRKVFAHYFGPYPRSINNSYTENTDTYQTILNNPAYPGRTDYRGWFRDAPLWRAKLSGDWRYTDAVFDIQAAQAAGIDGFFVDMLGLSGSNFDNYARLARAASDLDTGFFVVPMVDANGATGAASPAVAAGAVATFAGLKSSFYLPDGRFVVSSFRMEGKPVSWWSEMLSVLRGRIGGDVAFLSAALNAGNNGAYSSVTFGESTWGYGADPITIMAASPQAAAARGRGKVWMAPIECQDVRPAAGLFDEAANTAATRAAWERAFDDNSDYAQIVTWSDFSEGTTIAPSKQRGFATLDLNAWFIAKFHTGEFPEILRDVVILSHRSHLAASLPIDPPQVTVMRHWNRNAPRTPVRDSVEVLTFLVAPADVTVVVGGVPVTFTAPAGMHSRILPLVVGAPPSAMVTRGAALVAEIVSTVPVVAVPVRDDKSYYWFSSLRGTAGQKAPVGP